VLAEEVAVEAVVAVPVVLGGLELDVELVDGQVEHLGDDLVDGRLDGGVVERATLPDGHGVLADADGTEVVAAVEDAGDGEDLPSELGDEALDVFVGALVGLLLHFARDEVEVVLPSVRAEHAVELEDDHLRVRRALDDDAHLLLDGRRDLLLDGGVGGGGLLGAGHDSPCVNVR
jgi:hypothetical protein